MGTCFIAAKSLVWVLHHIDCGKCEQTSSDDVVPDFGPDKPRISGAWSCA